MVANLSNLKVSVSEFTGENMEIKNQDGVRYLYHYPLYQPRKYVFNFPLLDKNDIPIVKSERNDDILPSIIDKKNELDEKGKENSSLRLCYEIYNIPGVIEVSVHFHTITVSIYPNEDWGEINNAICELLKEVYPSLVL